LPGSTVLLLLLLVCGCAREPGPVVIRAVSLIPPQAPYTQDFRAWIDRLNERSEGLFRILYVGGPEVIPTYEQADAVRTGVVHMVFGPATYYLGALPQVQALFASDLTPMQTRANGGIALLDALHRERMGSRYLARALFIEFHLFLREPPRLDATGWPALTGLKLRGGPVWREFIADLGAVFVNLAAPDTYTALERGTIDGVGWPVVGLRDLSWDRHLRYRIDPGIFSSDAGILFNDAQWQRLPARAQAIIEAAAIEYERDSYERFRELTRDIDAELRAAGMQVVTLAPDAARRYRARARDVIWRRLANADVPRLAEWRQRFLSPAPSGAATP
jgi:TRAP-type C4-dicarboxylate transport system substrate-binding protein